MLKNTPEIPKGFNVLTAMANLEIDMSSIPKDKREDITEQIVSFYSEQPVAATAEATATIQSNESPVSFDYFMVKSSSLLKYPLFPYLFYLLRSHNFNSIHVATGFTRQSICASNTSFDCGTRKASTCSNLSTAF